MLIVFLPLASERRQTETVFSSLCLKVGETTRRICVLFALVSLPLSLELEGRRSKLLKYDVAKPKIQKVQKESRNNQKSQFFPAIFDMVG